MKVAKIPQPWASLLMTEAIEYILPFGENVTPGEVILIYATDKDDRYRMYFESEKVDDLWYNEAVLGNLDEELETAHFLGYVKAIFPFPRKADKIFVSDVHCFEKPIYSKAAKTYVEILKNPCKKKNYNTITFEGDQNSTKNVIIPLGKTAWKNLVMNEGDIYLYWNDEFYGLLRWLNSFMNELRFYDDEIHIIFKHENRKIIWDMLNDDIDKSFAPIYETDEKTGKKKMTGTCDVLYIGISQMESLYPDRELIDKERKQLLSLEDKEKPKEHREWVHILYTPMGNKR